ncbi:hypothetical protein A6V39_02730 [Candidatus Mycoplasma haematobovis]|uniref:Uncharacterized protein n=1 Tax=Candidatus Mycoplasma haematobovis TaxID=432608 RepID=A0A1A9QF47_9MOLU|nr:hypothetical protein [Candidatus Mycoplasma haematobovis]OAL10329.1 hypothetical protein A6V39_02730 [Candidatus Mycoplasma haematobovis]
MNCGVSGRLVIDGNGYILGVKSLASANKDRSLVVQLRSEELNNDRIKTPKYDLVVGGGEDQTSSYKEQVVKYILNEGRRTLLS